MADQCRPGTGELRGDALPERTTAQPCSFCLPAGLPFPVLRVRPLLLPLPFPRPLFDSHAVPRCPVFPKQTSLKLSRAGREFPGRRPDRGGSDCSPRLVHRLNRSRPFRDGPRGRFPWAPRAGQRLFRPPGEGRQACRRRRRLLVPLRPRVSPRGIEPLASAAACGRSARRGNRSGEAPPSAGPTSAGGAPSGRACFGPGLERRGGNDDGMEKSRAPGGPVAAACKKIAIFGATGMTGLATLAQALEAGEAGQGRQPAGGQNKRGTREGAHRPPSAKGHAREAAASPEKRPSG